MIDDTVQLWKVTVELDGEGSDSEMDIKKLTLVIDVGIPRSESPDEVIKLFEWLMARDFWEVTLKHIKSIKCEKRENRE